MYQFLKCMGIIALTSAAITCSDRAITQFTRNALIFSGSANPELAQKVVEHFSISLGKAKIGRFNDGEIHIQIEENVRNKDIFIIQPTCPSANQSVNDNFMELCLL